MALFSEGKENLLRLAEFLEKIERASMSEDASQQMDEMAKALGVDLSKMLRQNVLLKNIDDDYETEVKKQQLESFIEKRMLELAEE